VNRTLCVLGLTTLAIAALAAGDPPFHPNIPRAWDDAAVASMELPLVQRDRSPRYITSAEYYALTVRPIYRAYPAYVAGREPAGYLDSLKQKDPEVIFDPSQLHTKADWIRAGKLVFESETSFFPIPATPISHSANCPVASDGALGCFDPGTRYYVRKKGVVELGSNSCAGCHSAVLPDGTFFEGGQGNPAFGGSPAAIRNSTPEALQKRLNGLWTNYGAPWVMGKEDFQKSITPDDIARALEAQRPGTFARQGTSWSHPVRVPSLIGIADIHYLDATGLVRNRSIADIMRYAIINEGLDTTAHYGDFQPTAHTTSFSAVEGTRYSDEQLYALALYIESLQPPPNPNKFDALAQRGQKVFQSEGCPTCHTPPLYTNNKLNPVRGFKVPDDLRKTDAVMDTSIGTDPTLALDTRRGTGFYKVPSLRGLWYRTGYGHGGQAATLEEWFDPARLDDNYIPKGFHLAPGPIEGHEKGLDLSPDDKRALIAFLKTL
jgi:mono/diheme cytochrome c family protein